MDTLIQHWYITMMFLGLMVAFGGAFLPEDKRECQHNSQVGCGSYTPPIIQIHPVQRVVYPQETPRLHLVARS
jgi:hypothetical protein